MALFVANNGQLQTINGIYYGMSEDLREIKSMYIKNRLTEGVDFKRYEWLISNSKNNSTPFIDTLIPPQLNQVISFTFKVINSTTNGSEPGVYGAMSLSTWKTCLIRCFRRFGTDNYIRLEYNNNNNNDTGEGSMFIKEQFLSGKEYACSLSINSSTTALGVINNNSKQLIANSNVSLNLDPQPTHCIFTQVHNAKWSFKSVGFRKFEITNLISLVPCQLLKPIPATLDANNIARAAGECGMYDSISGKFFGNVANSGTFTVEGDVEPEIHTGLQQIYQNRLIEGVDYDVYTYLKGTGCCYIDTLINPAWNDQLSATTEVSGRPKVINPCILHANGSNTRVGMLLGGAWYKNNTPQFLVINKVVGTADYIEWVNFPANAELYASFKVVNNSIPTVSFKVNGASLTHKDINGSSIITELPDTTYKIGDAAANGLDVLNLKNIKINSHNFVPCKLKCSIPRNLDAQCKERVAGECGMIDLISGKFYGNVANSGTFTVKNDSN